MPIYEYRCKQCNHVFELKMTIEEKKKITIACPKCISEDVQQQLFGINFSGKKAGGGTSSGGCCGDGTGCCE